MKRLLLYFITVFIATGFHSAAFANNKKVDWRRYDHIDRDRIVPIAALRMAIEFYDQNYEEIQNKDFMAIADFSKIDTQRRFYVIDMRNGDVESLYVAHGINSESNNQGRAKLFSNIPDSKQSSLGFYLTEPDIYTGKWGQSLRIRGLESTNYKA